MKVIGEAEFAEAPAELHELIGKPDWSRFTLYMLDNRAALWVSCWFDAYEVGLWVDANYRHSPRMLVQIDLAFHRLLKTVPVVVCYTQQLSVCRLVERLGFAYVGSVPRAYASRPVHMYYTTHQLYQGIHNGSKHKRL